MRPEHLGARFSRYKVYGRVANQRVGLYCGPIRISSEIKDRRHNISGPKNKFCLLILPLFQAIHCDIDIGKILGNLELIITAKIVRFFTQVDVGRYDVIDLNGNIQIKSKALKA